MLEMKIYTRVHSVIGLFGIKHPCNNLNTVSSPNPDEVIFLFEINQCISSCLIGRTQALSIKIRVSVYTYTDIHVYTHIHVYNELIYIYVALFSGLSRR